MDKNNIKMILQDLYPDKILDPPPWHPAQQLLYAYIEAELEGKDAAQLYPDIKQNLERYAEFKADYVELKTILQLEHQGALIEPPRPLEANTGLNAFDLLWAYVEQTNHQVRRLFTEIPIYISQGVASFGTLPAQLQPTSVVMPGTRGSILKSETHTPNVAESAQMLSLLDNEQISFGLILGPVSGDQATIQIQLHQTQTQQPLRKARVTLRDDQNYSIDSYTIREETAVKFSNIDGGSYFVEIKHDNQTWELPLTFDLAKAG